MPDAGYMGQIQNPWLTPQAMSAGVQVGNMFMAGRQMSDAESRTELARQAHGDNLAMAQNAQTFHQGQTEYQNGMNVLDGLYKVRGQLRDPAQIAAVDRMIDLTTQRLKGPTMGAARPASGADIAGYRQQDADATAARDIATHAANANANKDAQLQFEKAMNTPTLNVGMPSAAQNDFAAQANLAGKAGSGMAALGGFVPGASTVAAMAPMANAAAATVKRIPTVERGPSINEQKMSAYALRKPTDEEMRQATLEGKRAFAARNMAEAERVPAKQDAADTKARVDVLDKQAENARFALKVAADAVKAHDMNSVPVKNAGYAAWAEKKAALQGQYERALGRLEGYEARMGGGSGAQDQEEQVLAITPWGQGYIPKSKFDPKTMKLVK